MARGALGGSLVEALGEAQAKKSSLRAIGRISCWEQAPTKSSNMGSPARIFLPGSCPAVLSTLGSLAQLAWVEAPQQISAVRA
jgi:hypothetical protein